MKEWRWLAATFQFVFFLTPIMWLFGIWKLIELFIKYCGGP